MQGQLRWSARARRAFAYVRQFGRFAGDAQFWRPRLGDPGSVQQSSGENRLRFRLHTREDFDRFEAATREPDVSWTGPAAAPDEDPA